MDWNNMTPAEEAAYDAWCAEQERRCGRDLTMGSPVDPYGVTCDLDRGHAGPHEGDHPLAETDRVRWTGGGYCAGDPLPARVLA